MALWPFVVAAICAGILMPVVIATRSIGYDVNFGVQHVHDAHRSRLGGAVVVLVSLVVFVTQFASSLGHARYYAEISLALASLPVIAVGLWEDLAQNVKPRYRLAACFASAILASVYAGGVVPRLDLGLTDDLLQYSWFIFPLTWFMVAGACNAINLIDGCHGLAGGTALMMFCGLAAAAGWYGDVRTLAEALVMAGALLGFLGWNYPRGHVFLGDGGAYFVGFMYAQISIRLIGRNDDISAWYVIMLAAYPIVETLFAIYRRAVIRRADPMAPDALHLHSLVFHRVTMPLERRSSHPDRCRANARVAPRLWLHGALCFAFATLFHNHPSALCVGLVGYSLFYLWQYKRIIRFRRKRQRSDARVMNKEINA